MRATRLNNPLRIALCLTALLVTVPSALAADARITKVEMGTSVTDDDEIEDPTTTFAPSTPKIYCVWKSDGVVVGTTLRGVWIAEDVGKVAPPNYKIDEASLTVAVANQGSFSLSKPNNGFPVGKYRLEIYFGKALLKTVPFTVEEE
jgi:hypothetical protein